MSLPNPPECSEADLPDPSPLSEERVALIAKGLAHPARIRIVELFLDHRCRTAHEVVDACELAQSTVSEHLRILREAEILSARKDGPRIWYCMRRSVVHQFAQAVEELTSTEVAFAEVV
jgi:DNA-binding transcriptional ArsR family regulator